MPRSSHAHSAAASPFINDGHGPAVPVRREPRGLYRRLFQLHHEPLLICTPSGSPLYVNPAFVSLTGYTEDELTATTLSGLCVDPRMCAAVLDEVASRPETVVEQCLQLRRKDGAIRDCLFTFALISSRADRAPRVYGSLRDITEHRNWGRMIQAREKRYRMLFEQSLDAVSLVRPDGLLLDANPPLLRLLGLTRSDIGTFHAPSTYVDPAARYPFVSRLISQEGVVKDEVLLRTKTGRIFLCARSGVAIRGDDDEVIGFQVVHRDVTEERKAEKALRRSQRKLRRLAARGENTLEEERKRIARELHDQVGQALTGMKLDVLKMSRGVESGTPVTPAHLSDLEASIDSTILDVRRISSELRPGILDDVGLVAALEWQLDLFGKRTGMECILDAAEAPVTLGESASTVLYRVYQELLTNVARHAKASKVEVRFRCDGGQCTLTVRDDGRGITREESLRSEALGLVGIRERLLPFGGTLKLRGRRGEGTVATVLMPILGA